MRVARSVIVCVRYLCEIAREDGVLVVTATSTVMALRGVTAAGR